VIHYRDGARIIARSEPLALSFSQESVALTRSPMLPCRAGATLLPHNRTILVSVVRGKVAQSDLRRCVADRTLSGKIKGNGLLNRNKVGINSL
jgi:hypothetical protein